MPARRRDRVEPRHFLQALQMNLADPVLDDVTEFVVALAWTGKQDGVRRHASLPRAIVFTGRGDLDARAKVNEDARDRRGSGWP